TPTQVTPTTVEARPADSSPVPSAPDLWPQRLARRSLERWRPHSASQQAAVGLGIIIGVILVVALIAAAVGQVIGQGAAQPTATVAQASVPAHQTYNAAAPALAQGDSVNLTLEVKEALISIAPGVAYDAWTFNGTVPGPVLRVRQGQTVNFTLVNRTNVPHSIDFHAAQTPWNANYQSISPGKGFSFSWRANVPGFFMYHCGTPPVMMHMANGMYGAIIVDPAQGWSPAKEYVLVQSEFYLHQRPDGSYGYDNDKAMMG